MKNEYSMPNIQRLFKFLAIDFLLYGARDLSSVDRPDGSLDHPVVPAQFTLVGFISFDDCIRVHLWGQRVILADGAFGTSPKGARVC